MSKIVLDTSSGTMIKVITPESVDLNLRLSDTSERIAGFFIDVLCIALICFLSFIPFLAIKSIFPSLESFLYGFLMIAIFFIRNGYFIYSELTTGTTLGKKIYKCQVIKDDGTVITTGAIYVRNLMREVEMWLPIAYIILLKDAPAQGNITQILPYTWIIVFAVIPFFDKKRRRIGDLLAGTLVVNMPNYQLEKDLAIEQQHQQSFVFTTEMLDIYGKNELILLEDILRKHKNMLPIEKEKLLQAVVEKISKKIGYKEPILVKDQLLFLEKFYKEQRAYLEKKLVRGQSLERKTTKYKKNK